MGIKNEGKLQKKKWKGREFNRKQNKGKEYSTKKEIKIFQEKSKGREKHSPEKESEEKRVDLKKKDREKDSSTDKVREGKFKRKIKWGKSVHLKKKKETVQQIK